MPKALKLKELSDKKNIPVSELERMVGVGNATFANAIKRNGNFKDEYVDVLSSKIDNLNKKWFFDDDEPMLLSDKTTIKSTDGSESLSMQAIFSLAESNKALARAHEELAQANNKLAQNALELTTMLKGKATVDVVQEIPPAIENRFHKMLRVLASQLTGTVYKNEDDGLLKLSKQFYENAPDGNEMGMPS